MPKKNTKGSGKPDKYRDLGSSLVGVDFLPLFFPLSFKKKYCIVFLVRLPNDVRLPVHSRQPRPARRDSDLLAKDHEDQQRQVVGGKDTAEDAGDDGDVAIVQDPGQQLEAHGERDGLLAQVHGDQHLGQVDRVAVDSVGEGEGEVEVGGPVDHGHPGKVAKPMQVLLRRVPVHDEARGANQHGGQEDAEAHLGLADPAVLLGQVGGEAVGRGGEGDGEDVTDRVPHGDQAGIGLGPVVGGRRDLEGKSVVERQGAEADVDAVGGDDPEHRRHREVGEGPEHGHEEGRLPVVHAPRFQSPDEALAAGDPGPDFAEIGVGCHLLLGLGGGGVDGGGAQPRLHFFALVPRLLDEDEGQDEQGAREREFDVEEKSPRVAAREHVPGVQGSGGSQAQADGVVPESLAAFVQEEDVVDKLDRQGFADP